MSIMWIELALLMTLPCVTLVLVLGMGLAKVGYGLWANVTRRGYFYE